MGALHEEDKGEFFCYISLVSLSTTELLYISYSFNTILSTSNKKCSNTNFVKIDEEFY